VGIALLAVVAAGCGRCGRAGGDDPEAQVRAVMARVEQAAKEADIKALRSFVSETYKDPDGRNKEAIGQFLTFHYLRNRSHHIFTVLRDVSLPEPDRARVEALVALAGQPISGPDALANVSANLFAFTFVLREEDDEWRFISTTWDRATPADFL